MTSQTEAPVADALEVELPAELRRYRLPPETQDPAGAMAASLALLDVAPRRVTIPLWAEVFLAPLSELLRPDFCHWLLAGTGRMKSTLAALFMAHYGEFDRVTLPENWSSTENRLEKHAF